MMGNTHPEPQAVIAAPPSTLSPRRSHQEPEIIEPEAGNDAVIDVPRAESEKEPQAEVTEDQQPSNTSRMEPETPGARLRKVTFNMKPQFDGGSSTVAPTPDVNKKKRQLKRLVSTVRVNTERSLAVGMTRNGQVLRLSSTVTPDLEAADFHNLNEVVSDTLVTSQYESFQVGPPVESNGRHLKKLQDYFNRVDLNKDGNLSEDELREALKLSLKANNVTLTPEVLDELVDLIMEEADLDGNGGISFEELATLFYSLDKSNNKGSGTSSKFMSFLSDNTEEDPIDELPDKPTELSHWTKGLLHSKIFRQEVHFYLANNWQQVFFISLWLQLCGLVFAWRFRAFMLKPVYEITGFWISFSKGSAEVVKLNMALLLLSVCKNSMTYLRSTFLGHVIPFDDRIEFHKLSAGMVVFTSFTHTLGHLVGNYAKISGASAGVFHKVFGHSAIQPTYMDFLRSPTSQTGYILWGSLGVLAFFALNSVRKFFKKSWVFKYLGGFEAFWWTHMLLFPTFFFVAIFHGSHRPILQKPTNTTWMYLVPPLILYLLERLNRILLSRTRYAVDVIRAEVLPGKVVALHMSAPPFMFKSGMYVYVQVPGISSFEWHPFSITSAPSDFELSIYARAVGDWTNELLDFWEREIKKADSMGVDITGKTESPILLEEKSTYKFPRVLIEGPVGAPAQDYERFRVAVLVGGGIGVTPFSSVLRDVLHKSKNRRKYPRFKVEKVYFNWTTREQSSFEWFREIMENIAEKDDEGIMTMNNFLTSVYGDDDPKSFLLKAMQQEYHQRTGVDIITNQRTKILTHFARPDWNLVLSDIMANHPKTKIGVFVCGPEALSGEIRKKCYELSISSRNGSSFFFRKEKF